jgi:outer membrane protein OmpA-like peptidoglycan-associated protein
MSRLSLAPLVSTAVLFSLGLAACGDRDASNTTADTQPPPVDAPPEPAAAPQPSAAEQHEVALTSAGAELTDEGLQVTLASADFASGKTAFEPASPDRMEHVAGLLKDRDNLRVVVSGYTDDRGSNAANERLSMQRAESVRDYLVAQGVDASRIEVKGMGEADPVATNDTEEGRAQNRRVELRIVNEAGKYETLVSR